uniref:glucuronosyltransferase n=1 Tax=Meloidogyne enterolobii TaxID=390850 RepID=A0A6V7VGZ1_MELEN|nr:unnamed protein product [Meloidogyne enterolobii]
MPGDWLNNEGLLVKDSKRYMENMLKNVVASRNLAYLNSHLSLAIFNSFYNEGNVKDLRLPSSIEFLLTKIKLHFVNQNSLANFKEFPASEKIISIGGLLVEQNKILIEEKVKAEDNEPNCVVLVTFGTINLTGMFDVKSMEKMFEEFEKHSHSKINTKLFISHCGQNSLIEAIYAGVPLICIPNNADQFYNSSLVEHLGIGIYVKLKISDENEVDSEVFGVDFQNALNKMMIDNSIYQKTSNELRTKILVDLKENGPKKNIFRKKISEVIDIIHH